MKTSHLIIGGVAVIGAVSYLGYKKVESLADTFDKMTIKPVGARNFKPSWGSLKFNLDVALHNPTAQDFAVNGMVATLKRLVMNYKGQFLGYADLNIDEISIPKFNTLVIRDLPITVGTGILIQNLLSVTSLDFNDLQITAVIEALGSEFTISQ